MLNQIVQWIFLPNGLTDDGHLAASIFVAPRLRSDGDRTLADFPDFLDWPAVVNGALPKVTLQREDKVTEAPMKVTGGGSSELWKALFPPETPVRAFKFEDYADRPLVTYPLRPVLDYLSGKWASLAASSIDDLPISSTNASPIGPTLQPEQVEKGRTLSGRFEELSAVKDKGIQEGVSDARKLSERMAEALRSAAAKAAALRAQHHSQQQYLIQPFAPGNTNADHFYQLEFFHRRPERLPAEFPRDLEAARSELDKKTDFHQLLSALGDHPELLRALGLVFDLVIRPGFLPTLTDQDVPSSVRVRIERHSNFPTRSDPALSPWNLDVTPCTNCRLAMGPDGASFSAAENGGSQGLVHGFVLMDPARFTVVGVDVDGLALKVLNMATTLDTQEKPFDTLEKRSQRPVEEEARSGTPAPRTGGIALALTGRADEMHRDFYLARNANDGLESNPTNPPVLFAGQLVRGYRVDVRDGNTGKWRSLHARRVDYTPLRNPKEALSVEDEGFVQVSLAGEVDRPEAPADPDGALYVHEVLTTWDGWSLASQRPGSAIAQEPAPPAASADLSALHLDLKVNPLPASLPRLRFGANYRMRLRTVDLAGKSHTLDRANDLTTLLEGSGLQAYRVTLPENDFVYRRFEPVPPPNLVARTIFSPGEGLERLVVRSNAGVSAENYAAASQAAADETLRYRPFCDRHIVPPKASLQLAEAHGMFDKAFDVARGLPIEQATTAVDRFYQIAVRENGSFQDHPGARFVTTGVHQVYVFSWNKIPGTDDIRLKEFLSKRYHIDWVYAAGIVKSTDGKTINISKEDKTLSLTLDNEESEVILKIGNNGTYKFAAKKENGELNIYPQGEPQGYVTIDADKVTLPYLPDPFASGVVIRLQFSPIVPEQRFEIKFDQEGDWHQLLSILLRLEEGGPSAAFDEAKRLFTVHLPKGRTARMRLNSLFRNDANLFGIMDWCRKCRKTLLLSPGEVDQVFQAISESRHWMTTPWSTLHLVHAVQQPLRNPHLELTAVEKGTFKRKIGATAAELEGTIKIDGASTASLDLTAEWDDIVDDPTSGLLDVANMKRHMRANVFQIVLPEPWGTPWADEIKLWLEPLDTDGGQELKLVKFATDVHGVGPQRRRAAFLQNLASAATVQGRIHLATAAAQLEGLRSHEFGDTRYRRVAYQLVAATRFREYFDPKMPAEAGLRKGNVVMIDMLSSAPPSPPDVLDVVPIVHWEHEGTAGGEEQTSTRRTAGLRVWLAQPWFASGEGEMLGVVCGGTGPVNPDGPLYHEISVISQDPTHATRLPLPLLASSIRGAEPFVTNVHLGTGDQIADVAPFRPQPAHYDEARDAWYCDIGFETSESYMPFVRLGLVRYQPKSIPGCHVSSIVTTAFLQPLPDRSLTVVRQAADRVAVKLRGPAPRSHAGGDGSPVAETNVVVAVVEVQDPNTSDPTLGWVTVGKEVLLAPILDGVSQVEWSAEVPLPAEAARPLRLAVREYEVHPTDDRSKSTPVLVEGRRLVHADTVPLG